MDDRSYLPTLKEKTVVVTGAGTAAGMGNGQAIATAAARSGASVVCVDLSQERADTTATRLRKDGHAAIGVAANVTDPGDCGRVADAAVQEFGRIDALVNNVGVVSRNGLAPRVDGGALPELQELDLDDWRFVFETNVTSAMLMTRAVHEHMARSGGGAVVNVGSTMAYRWYGGGSLAYATAKSALEGLTMASAGALGPLGIRVNLLVIGQVRAPHIDRAAAGMDPEQGRAFLEHRRTSGLVQSEGTPWDVADTALYLIGPSSRWVTAQTVFVDAGVNKTMR
jgi:NAD(P)-dependent dehydrogenase (short-subunit alcohol dehydrogenase family)